LRHFLPPLQGKSAINQKTTIHNFTDMKVSKYLVLLQGTYVIRTNKMHTFYINALI
jgi:hypothetical protein